MKYIILVRHGSYDKVFMNDFAGDLNPEGVGQIEHVAGVIKEKYQGERRIIAQTGAPRVCQTADILENMLGASERMHAGVDDSTVSDIYSKNKDICDLLIYVSHEAILGRNSKMFIKTNEWALERKYFSPKAGEAVVLDLENKTVYEINQPEREQESKQNTAGPNLTYDADLFSGNQQFRGTAPPQSWLDDDETPF